MGGRSRGFTHRRGVCRKFCSRFQVADVTRVILSFEIHVFQNYRFALPPSSPLRGVHSCMSIEERCRLYRLTRFSRTSASHMPNGPASANQGVPISAPHIHTQLAICAPLLDEIQRAPEELLDNVIDIFDTAGAAPALIEEDADSKFKRSKKRALLQNIVPFLPLSRNDMRWVAARELKELGKHLSAEYTFCWGGQLTWSPPICDWMANQCHADDTCRLDGGRGIDTMVISSVNPK